MPNDQALRENVTLLLRAGRAHVDFEQVVANWPEDLRGKKPRGIPYSPWQLLDHMRITQWDILEYIRNPHHTSPSWPDGYWPQEALPARGEWTKSVKAFQADREALLDMLANPSIDPMARVPPGDPEGVTVLHELLLAADHNAYHLGQLVTLRRLLGAWRE